MNLAVHPVFVSRGSRKNLFALPPAAARRIRNIGSATATLCSLLFTILRLLRLSPIVVAPHCRFKLVPRAISFEFDAGYLTRAPNEGVFDDYDDARWAQIIVVDDDALDDETSSEPQDASRPLRRKIPTVEPPLLRSPGRDPSAQRWNTVRTMSR